MIWDTAAKQRFTSGLSNPCVSEITPMVNDMPDLAFSESLAGHASVQNVQRHPADLLAILVGHEDSEVTSSKVGPLFRKASCDLFSNVQRLNVVRLLSATFVAHCLGIHQIEMIARHVQPVEFPVRNASRRGSFRHVCGL